MSQRIERVQKTAVLIPAFNAESTLAPLLAKLVEFVSPHSILVVDDGSEDRTAALAEELDVRVVRLGRNCGKGSALSRGFEVLKKESAFESVITLDADLQHPPKHIPDFIRARSESGADIVVGLRTRLGTRMPVHRRMSNAISSFLVSLRTGERILDSQCGYRMIGMNVLSAICIDSTGFEAETEFLIKAVKKGFSVRFIPIETVYNDEGSHMTNWETTKRFVKILLRDY